MDRGRTRRGLMQAVGGGLVAVLATRIPVAGALAQAGTPCPSTTAEEAEAVAEAYFAAFNPGDADALGLLRQLGVVPEISPTAATPTG